MKLFAKLEDKLYKNVMKKLEKKTKAMNDMIDKLMEVQTLLMEAEKQGKIFINADTDPEFFKKMVELVNKEPDLHVQLITRDGTKLDVYAPQSRTTFRTTHFTGIEND